MGSLELVPFAHDFSLFLQSTPSGGCSLQGRLALFKGEAEKSWGARRGRGRGLHGAWRKASTLGEGLYRRGGGRLSLLLSAAACTFTQLRRLVAACGKVL